MLVNGYLSPDRLRIDIETVHVDGDVDVPNAVGLSPAELAARKVEYIDIRAAHADPAAKGYKASHDCSKFKSARTGRGPLAAGWERSGAVAPVMCCYKVVRADFKVFGLQGTGEGAILSQQRALFADTLCRAFVTVDEWVDKSLADIRAVEAEVARRSNAQLEKTRASATPLAAGLAAA